jgi:chloramphenicol-sensitive protein RarD
LRRGTGSHDRAEQRKGLLFGLGAYGSWGLLPLYLKALAAASPVEILCHRVLWAQLFLIAIVWRGGRLPELRAAFRPSRTLATLGLTTILIALNWLLYIWAIVSGHVLEASLGYYINPLVNVLLGVLVLKERLDRAALLAVALAAAAVLWLVLRIGSPPWLSLALALTFGLYGLLRKSTPVSALAGVTVETMLLLPLVSSYLVRQAWLGRGSFLAGNPMLDALFVMAGPVTAIPLLLFGGAARRLPLWTLGLLQYLSPSVQFLLAVGVFGEHLSLDRLIAFAFIWIALVIFATTRR